MNEPDHTDWAEVAIFNAREDMENGYGDYALKRLIDCGHTWKSPFGRQRIWAAIRELSIEPWDDCPTGRHGVQEIEMYGTSRGFAGGTVYWKNYACGCADMDESADVRAAY
jgi:hypothetical protein